MKKHLLGFALFVLIVGTSAFIFSMFNVGNVAKVYVQADYSTYSSGKSCWKMKRTPRTAEVNSPIVRQAVFNFDRKQVKLELLNALVTEKGNLPVVLHFFRKDANGSKYIASEPILFISESTYNSDGGVTSLITGSYDWLHDLDSYENLYVAAEYAPARRIYSRNFQPKFDSSQAVPVLVDYGK